jgi:hypothetical protein
MQIFGTSRDAGHLIGVNLGTVEDRDDHTAFTVSPDTPEVRIGDGSLNWVVVARLLSSVSTSMMATMRRSG